MAKLKQFNKGAKALIKEEGSIEYLKSVGFLDEAKQVLVWLDELEELRTRAKRFGRTKTKRNNRRIKK